MPEHPKVVGLSDGAFRVHISAICYAARNETDGHISGGAVRQFGWQRRVRELTEARLWDPCADGFTIDSLGLVMVIRGETQSPARRAWQRVAAKIRPLVFARDGRECRLCGAAGEFVRFHVDHIIPLAKGGSNELNNLQVLCQPCNQRKWAH